MSKFVKVMIALLAVAVIATPAMAEMKLNGYFRVMGTSWDNGTQTNNDISQRLRMKLTNTLNDNVSFVYYAEADTDWGQSGKGDIGGGGKIGADGVLLETKNVYLDLKTDMFTTRVGIQGLADTFDQLYFDDDMAGIAVNTKAGAAAISLLYSKTSEGDKAISDDANLYGAVVGLSPSDALSLGVSLYYYADDAANTSNLIYGVNAGFKASEHLSFSGFVSANSFTDDNTGAADGGTYNLNADATYAYDNGSVTFRAFYAPQQDNSEDFTKQISESAFDGDQLMFLGSEAYATNNGAGEDRFKDALYQGKGLLALILNGKYKFTNAMYTEYALAYMDTDTDPLGTEVNLKVGKKVLGNVDLSLKGAAFMPGDFYGAADDTQTKLMAMMNVSF